MATVSVRLSDKLNEKLDEMVDEGLFKNKTDAFHEAVRKLLLEYDDYEV